MNEKNKIVISCKRCNEKYSVTWDNCPNCGISTNCNLHFPNLVCIFLGISLCLVQLIYAMYVLSEKQIMSFIEKGFISKYGFLEILLLILLEFFMCLLYCIPLYIGIFFIYIGFRDNTFDYKKMKNKIMLFNFFEPIGTRTDCEIFFSLFTLLYPGIIFMIHLDKYEKLLGLYTIILLTSAALGLYKIFYTILTISMLLGLYLSSKVFCLSSLVFYVVFSVYIIQTVYSFWCIKKKKKNCNQKESTEA